MAKEYKWGYIDRDGRLAIPPRFHDAWGFSEGLAVVKLEWASGYIDRSGRFVIEPKYQYAGPFNGGRALIQTDGMWEYIAPSGKSLSTPTPPRPADASPAPPETGAPDPAPVFSEGLAPMPKGRNYGYIDESGAFVIKPRFIQAEPFSEGLAPVLMDAGVKS